MANEEQLALLRQGVNAWNQWREKHLEIRPDLRRADLSRTDLSGAKLHYAFLGRADLSGASLRSTNFKGTHLSRANLSGATLWDANLSGADLSNANLSGATLWDALLWDANLTRTNLSGADLKRADLRGATLDGAKLNNATLRKAKLNKAKLNGADLSGAELRDADLSGATLHGAKLNNAHLSSAHLEGATLSGATLSEATLYDAFLSSAHLEGAHLEGAHLEGAHLSRTDLEGAHLEGAHLSEANLSEANLSGADLSRANLSRANLSRATLVGTNLREAILTDCSIYGIAVWNSRLEGAKQDNLIITPEGEPMITVDDLEVAQFVHLLLNHQKLRNVLNSVTQRGVLLLGRFGGGGLEVLQAVAARLREAQYLPIIFDFERPRDRNYTETVKTLAGLSRFVIADLSGPSVPQELYATVPHFKIPFVPILEAGRKQFAMASDLLEYPWVVRPPVIFASADELVSLVPSRIIAPAEEKHLARQQLLNELFPS